MAITVSLAGGLGNQMFCYAAGLAAAERLRTSLRVWKPPHAERPYQLDRLMVPQDEVDWAPVPSIWLRRVANHLPVSRPFIYARRGVYRERTFHYDPAFESVSDGTILQGFFQSWRYFAQVEATVRSHFQLREPLSDRSLALKEAISRTPYSVSLHLRRGDYLTPKNRAVFNLLAPDYYSRAIALLLERVGTPISVFVFSDQVDPIHDGGISEKVSAVVHASPNIDRPWEDMALMALCSSNIIANSSFSWWGAWLNQNPRKIVVAPRRWFAETAPRSFDIRDLFPPTWVSL